MGRRWSRVVGRRPSALCLTGAPVVCVLVPVILGMTHLFRNSVHYANLMGVQRMRTQRLLKEALVVATNASAPYDPRRRYEKLRRADERLRRWDAFGGVETAREASREIRRLEEVLLVNTNQESWTEAEEIGDEITRIYGDAVERNASLAAACLWFVVVFTGLGFVLMTLYAVRVHASVSLSDEQKKRVQSAEDEVAVRKFEAEVLNHRLGNKIRLNRLLLEQGHYEQLQRNFDAWTWEVEIRRGCFENLPMTAVTARELFATEFSFHHTLSCFTDRPLVFRNQRGRQLSYAIIQHNFLQDIASNIIKYGGSCADVVIERDRIVIANDIVRNDRLPKSRKTGIVALRRLGLEAGTPIEFDRTDSRFWVTIYARIAEEPSSSSSSVASSATSSRPAPTEPEEEPLAAVRDTHDPADYHWMLIDDSETICALTAKTYKTAAGVDIVTLPKPSDALNIVTLVLEAAFRHRKPIILVMDEHLLSLDAHYRCVAETSTHLRRILLDNPRVADLLRAHLLFFVSASASKVRDPNLLCTLGKTLSTKAQINKVLDAIRRLHAGGHAAHAPSCNSTSSFTSSSFS